MSRIRTEYFRLYKKRQRYTASGRAGSVCVRCGMKSKLEYAHLDKCFEGMGRGALVRIRAVILHPTCFVRLCVECHRAFDTER